MNEDAQPNHLYGHFTRGSCNWEQHLRIQPVELLDANLNVKEVLQKEDDWIKKLRTMYPYGLNSYLNLQRTFETTVEKLFEPIKRGKRPRGNGKKVCRTFSPQDFFAKIQEDKQQVKKAGDNTWIHNTRVKINTRRKKELQQLSRWTHEVGYDRDKDIITLLQDMIDTRLLADTPKTEKKEEAGPKWVIQFENEAFNWMRLPAILRTKEVLDTVPEKGRTLKPCISYKYTEIIRNKIFNYRETAAELKGRRWENTKRYSCQCRLSRFKHPTLEHVMTGDLDIVEHREVRNLLQKGPYFRERPKIDWQVIHDAITLNMDSMIAQWAKEAGMQDKTGEWDKWKNTVLDKVKARIEHLKARTWNTTPKILQDNTEGQRYLNKFHQQYVLIPADKCEKNVIVVCKQFYQERMKNELLRKDGAYQQVQGETATQVANRIATNMRKTFGQKFQQDKETGPVPLGQNRTQKNKLASFYMTAKMHKTPPDFRFIAASHNCVTKDLSRTLSRCLRRILQEHREISRKYAKDNHIDPMWVADNRDRALKDFRKSTV